MRAAFFATAFAATALAQSQSSSIDPFPQTSYLAQTNSLGVVTGQPGVATSIPEQPGAVTSQPAVATSVGEAASIPAVGTGIHTVVVGGTANSTRTFVVSANNSTTIILNGTPTGSGASVTGSGGASATGSGASGSGGATETVSGSAQSTGAAATMRAVAGGLVGAGAFVAAFL